MGLHKEDALQIAQDFLKDKSYRETVFGTPYFVPHGSKLNDGAVDYWTVPFEHRIFDMEAAFVHIEDSSGSIMYVLTAHGRQFINGEPEPAQDDDDDDWDDDNSL